MSPNNLKPASQIKGGRWMCFLVVLPILLGCGTVGAPAPLTSTPTASFTPTGTLTPTPTPAPSPTTTPTPTPTEIPPFCGGPRAMFILLVGSDARSNSYSIGLADAIRLVRVDFVAPRVQLLTFPRDLYVVIPGIEERGITQGKLNQAFLYGNPGYGYFDGPGQGPGLLALTLERNFDVHTDHFVAVNLQTFTKIVDALGGVDIRLPYEIDGRVQGSKDPDRYFPAGNQHLNGYRTMLLARMRPKGDLERSEIQNLIITAFAEKLFSQAGLTQLPKLIKSFQDTVQTDLGTREIVQLTCLAAMVGTQGIEYADFPEDLFEPDRVRDPVLGNTSILKADFSVLKTYVQKFQKGEWCDPGNSPNDEFTP